LTPSIKRLLPADAHAADPLCLQPDVYAAFYEFFRKRAGDDKVSTRDLGMLTPPEWAALRGWTLETALETAISLYPATGAYRCIQLDASRQRWILNVKPILTRGEDSKMDMCIRSVLLAVMVFFAARELVEEVESDYVHRHIAIVSASNPFTLYARCVRRVLSDGWLEAQQLSGATKRFTAVPPTGGSAAPPFLRRRDALHPRPHPQRNATRPRSAAATCGPDPGAFPYRALFGAVAPSANLAT
jgi:hypothetical protein